MPHRRTHRPNGQKVGDLYNLAMDSTRRNELGNSPILPLLQEAAALTDRADILPLVARNYRRGIGGFFATGIGSDIMDSNKNLLTVAQAGLSLPEKATTATPTRPPQTYATSSRSMW